MLEAFMIFAFEICVGSAQYDHCVHWMIQCQIDEVAKATRWSYEDGAERCAETLPTWATEGM